MVWAVSAKAPPSNRESQNIGKRGANNNGTKRTVSETTRGGYCFYLHLLEVLPRNGEDHGVDAVRDDACLQAAEEEPFPAKEAVLSADLGEGHPVADRLRVRLAVGLEHSKAVGGNVGDERGGYADERVASDLLHGRTVIPRQICVKVVVRHKPRNDTKRDRVSVRKKNPACCIIFRKHKIMLVDSELSEDLNRAWGKQNYT